MEVRKGYFAFSTLQRQYEGHKIPEMKQVLLKCA